jgi:hypothetical protein
MIARKRANTAAAQKPFVLNPPIRLSTRRTMRTLIIKETSPSVSQLSGAVIILRRNPIVALTSPSKRATMRAIVRLSIWTPGTIYPAAKTASVENISEIMKFIKRG